MGTTSATGAEILPCPADRLAEALGILYGRVPARLRDALVVEACREVAEGRLDVSGLWIARRRDRVVGAILTQRLARGAAALWPPVVGLFWARAAVAAALVRAAVDGQHRAGVRLVQATLEDDRGHPELIQGGMRRVTELTYLARDTGTPLYVPATAPRLDWVGYATDVEPAFAAILEATYHGSRDMPELAGSRSLDELLAIHRSAGCFDADLWCLGRDPTDPDTAAIVILNAVSGRPVWEIAYLGLTPAARGRGLGRATLAHALWLARERAARLELAVDQRNEPARHLYHATGFVPFDRKTIYMALADSRAVALGDVPSRPGGT